MVSAIIKVITRIFKCLLCVSVLSTLKVLSQVGKGSFPPELRSDGFHPDGVDSGQQYGNMRGA